MFLKDCFPNYFSKTVPIKSDTKECCCKTTRIAIEKGHFDCMIKNYKNNIGPWNVSLSVSAAKMGDLKSLRYVCENGCGLNEAVCIEAAKKGSYDCLQYAHKNGCTLSELVVSTLATNGHTRCLEYAIQNNCAKSLMAAERAAANGHLECLKLLVENGFTVREYALSYAASAGHLHILQYLVPLELSINKKCMYGDCPVCKAAMNRHIECVKYLHQKGGYALCNRISIIAVKNGDIECLKYAHENLCKWDENTTKAAAESGKLECLKYLYEHGCSWDKKTIEACFVNDTTIHYACLKYAYANYCPMGNVCNFYNRTIYVSNDEKKYAEKVVKTFDKMNIDILKDPRNDTGMYGNVNVYGKKEHSVSVDGKCATCLLKKYKTQSEDIIMKIDWNSAEIRNLTAAQPFLEARDKIYRAMERAYLNPEYAWCIRRLKREYMKLKELTNV